MQFDAVVFPGQGAQKKGMARDFAERYDVAAHLFEMAKGQLSFDPYQVCFEDDERLHQTAFTQPCILLAEMAMYFSLQKAYGLSPKYLAGHSLGEYAALVAAEVLPSDLALTLVAKRGELMQNTNVDGGMAAVIMDEVSLQTLKPLADKHNVDIANDNSISQVVLSGDKTDLNALLNVLEDTFSEQSYRAVPLNVSAPFHSRYMKEIEEVFFDFLKSHQDSFALNNLPKVVSNFLGGFYSGSRDELVTALARQLSGSVRWRDNMMAITQQTSSILELGPNRPLRGFFKTLNVDIASVINVKSADKIFKG